MRKFTGIVENDKYKVGCTGRTVYVLDKQGNELAKFRDVPYGYRPLISPDRSLAVVKSTAGWLAFYDLEALVLLKRIKFSDKGSQDDGICFSPDGNALYNIERRKEYPDNVIVKYDVRTFEHNVVLNLPDCAFTDIRYGPWLNTFCVLGFSRKGIPPLIPCGSFIAFFDGNQITNTLAVSPNEEYSSFIKLTTAL